MTHPEIFYRLRTAQLATIQSITESEDLGISEIYVKTVKQVYDFILGDHGGWEGNPSIEPTRLKIPEAQWLRISGWLMDAAARLKEGDIARVNIGLDWMNQGPSSFKVEEST